MDFQSPHWASCFSTAIWLLIFQVHILKLTLPLQHTRASQKPLPPRPIHGWFGCIWHDSCCWFHLNIINLWKYIHHNCSLPRWTSWSSSNHCLLQVIKKLVNRLFNNDANVNFPWQQSLVSCWQTIMSSQRVLRAQ